VHPVAYLQTILIMLVPSNATQRMYNVQFNLLILQHVSTIFRSSSGEYKCLPNAFLNCRAFGKQLYSPDDDQKTVKTCCEINKLN
jgi:hypothetical protein